MADEKHLPEFFSEWHQEAYVEGLHREAAGYKNRIAELKAMGVRDDEPSLLDAQSGAEAVKAELDRLSPKKKAPAKKAKSAG